MTWRPLSFICSSLILLAWKRDTSANASMRRSWLLPQNTKQSVPFCWDSVLPLFLRRVGVHRKGALALFGAWNLREIVNKFCVHVCVQQGLGDLELQRKVDAHMHNLASTRLCWRGLDLTICFHLAHRLKFIEGQKVFVGNCFNCGDS